MSSNISSESAGTILLVGASRGLGLALAAEFLRRSWNVIATVRGNARTGLDDLARDHVGRLEIEHLDITHSDEIDALHHRLATRTLDILFVNAGITNADPDATIGEVSTEEFVKVMVTNALAPMRTIERLDALVASDGLIGVMSSGQGSISNNERGGREVYRGTKAALNMYMRSYATRHDKVRRSLVLIAPGWVRTDLGGPGATYSIEETVPRIVDIMLAKRGRPGLEYLDRDGNSVRW